MAPPRRLSDSERKANRAASSKAWHERNPDYKKGWIANNQDRVHAAQQKHLNEKPHLRKNSVLKYRYGITLAERDAMLLQEGGCAICGSPNSGSIKGWQTDHDHKTGKVRGVLCIRCNTLLGIAKDSIKTLKAAINYLRRAAA